LQTIYFLTSSPCGCSISIHQTVNRFAACQAFVGERFVFFSFFQVSQMVCASWNGFLLNGCRFFCLGSRRRRLWFLDGFPFLRWRGLCHASWTCVVFLGLSFGNDACQDCFFVGLSTSFTREALVFCGVVSIVEHWLVCFGLHFLHCSRRT